MQGNLLDSSPTDPQSREAAHLQIAQRLLDELGDEADDHCLTIIYHMLRAGQRAAGDMILRFASQAAAIAFEHRSYYLAGKYFAAAARASSECISPLERADLYCRAGDAFHRWADEASSAACYRQAVKLYEQGGNDTGAARATQALHALEGAGTTS